MSIPTALAAENNCIVYAVFPDRKSAEELSTEFVSMRLAACANVFAPHTAIYSWQGKIEQAQEVAVIFKTTASAAPKLMHEIKSRHSYENPAILSWNLQACSPEYANWVRSAVKA